MIKLSMNENRRNAIAMMPLLEYADDDHNFIDNPDYLQLRNLLQKTQTETGPLILTTAAQATDLAQICEHVADGCADNMGMFDSDGYYRRKFLTHNRMLQAIIKDSKKAGWIVISGGASCVQITEDK
jgi:hypothetical protein